MGPAKVVFSPHRLSRPSVSGLRSVIFLTLRKHFSEGETVPVRKIKVRLKSQHLSPILETCIQTKKETPSGSVLRLQDIQELRTCVFLRKHSKNALHFCEPDLSFAYDQNSNLTNLTNPANQTIDYTYDALNRLTGKTGLTGSTDYTYDLGSRLTGITGITGSTSSTYIYDALNRITSTTQTVNSLPFTVSYQYDSVGNRTQVTYPSGSIYNYAYDELNRLTGITGQTGSTIASYTYDTLSRRTKLELANSTFSEYEYDNLNRLTTLRNKSPRYRYIPFAENTNSHESNTNEHEYVSANSRESLPDRQAGNANIHQSDIRDHSRWIGDNSRSNLLSTLNDFLCPDAYAQEPVQHLPYSGVFSNFSYTYDDVGNRLSALQQHASSQVTENYGYDDIYQLISNQSQVTSNQYDYDSVGNREVVTQNSQPTNYTTNNLNQYSQVGTTPYSYDANGNLLSDGTNAYIYDPENRLITSTNNQLQTTNYSYDGLGRRVSKNVNGTVTYYIYDGDRIIEERDTNGTLLKSYIYGTGIDEILLYTNYQQQTTNNKLLTTTSITMDSVQ